MIFLSKKVLLHPFSFFTDPATIPLKVQSSKTILDEHVACDKSLAYINRPNISEKSISSSKVSPRIKISCPAFRRSSSDPPLRVSAMLRKQAINKRELIKTAPKTTLKKAGLLNKTTKNPEIECRMRLF